MCRRFSEESQYKCELSTAEPALQMYSDVFLITCHIQKKLRSEALDLICGFHLLQKKRGEMSGRGRRSAVR